MYDDEENAPRGEYVLIVAGKSRQEIEMEKKAFWEDISIEEHLKRYIDEGMSKKEAVKKVSEERDIPKREVYAVSVKFS